MRTKSYFTFALTALLLFNESPLPAQTRAEKKIIKQLQTDIEYLASDALEGRRTGTEGEKKAADYLVAFYKKEKIQPYKGSYRHSFPFAYGKKIGSATQIKAGTRQLEIPGEAFPLPFSAGTDSPLLSEVLPEVYEQGNIWLIPLYTEEKDASNPHFDYEKEMYGRAREAAGQGAAAVVFYDHFNAKYPPQFNHRSEYETLDIPVAFLSFSAFEAYVKNRHDGIPVSLKTSVQKKEGTGINIAAFIDNGARYTVVLGAHYDHLGYGEDGNSLYAGKERQIHNGADDNASGTAGLMQLASRIKKDGLRNYNYLFLHFSGEELGLLGSRAIVKEMQLDSNRVAYMINLDMIGRLNDSTHALTVGGVGTSPVWGRFISPKNPEFRIGIDSSGIGPSDHTSFYLAGVPVLFFFTGVHRDYHKPGDDAYKINYFGEVRILDYIYNIISGMEKEPRPRFTPTRQPVMNNVSFKVTLGIMPDYSFQGEGVRADGIIEDRPAEKAGIKAGDVIIKLGTYSIKGMQSYMEALSHFESGQTITVTIERAGKIMELSLKF